MKMDYPGLGVLELLGVAPAAGRILRYFLVRPDARPHARELQRALGLGGSSLARELDRMVALGALCRVPEGRRVHYATVAASPVWKAVGILEAGSADPTVLVREALCDMDGLEAAFIFGSGATGAAREDSDIDLLVIERDDVDRRRLFRRLAAVGLVLGREVNVLRYTARTLADRLGDPEHPGAAFVGRVLRGPKRWVAGTPAAIAPLVRAGGLDPDALTGSAA